MNRRRFIKHSMAASLALGAAPYVIGQQPGRKFRTALIGCGWWGKIVLKEAIASGRCQVTALCDVSQSTLEVAGDQVNDLAGETPKLFGDHRELLEKAKPEVVIIATPDHWHALQTIDSSESGRACVCRETDGAHRQREPGDVESGARERARRASGAASARRSASCQWDEISSSPARSERSGW